MQPYFFPYIGYFQLINSVDKFIFYDDVSFIKNGWINRNKILINKAAAYFTLNLKRASSNRLINATLICDNRQRLIKTLNISYKNAPYYEQVMPLVNRCLATESHHISVLAMTSVMQVCQFLAIDTVFEKSSEAYPATCHLKKVERLKQICALNGAAVYHNSAGGMAVYSREDFRPAGIELRLVRSQPLAYRQFKHDFVPKLSIIDVLMFNSVEQTRSYLENYELF